MPAQGGMIKHESCFDVFHIETLSVQVLQSRSLNFFFQKLNEDDGDRSEKDLFLDKPF